jgi:energy-coupling factor transport system substrate-specific component
MIKKSLRYIILVVAIPLIVFVGFAFFDDRQYSFISFAVAILACIPFFLAYEDKDGKSEVDTRKIIVLAVMITISVLGRFIFAAVPFFKPVTAIIVVVAIYFGSEMGFLCGALSALISNFYFGQGPWTPFQMFIWGLIGFLAGIIARHLIANKIYLTLFGVFAGVIYSLAMDIWVVVWFDGTFNLSRYIAALIIALPITAIYAISNVVFLLIITKPIGKKLNRLKVKYGI